MESKNIYNLIILDESGSMQYIERQAVSAVNETLQGIRKACEQCPGNNYYVSIVVFEGNGPEGVRTLRECEPIVGVKDIEQGEYRPGSCTPLYDAIGISISNLDKMANKDDAVLVTIITDGMENSSKEYSASIIKHLVAKKRKVGWTFAYIGANQDSVEVAGELEITNALNFEATQEGTAEMGSILSDATMNFCNLELGRMSDFDKFFEKKERK